MSLTNPTLFDKYVRSYWKIELPIAALIVLATVLFCADRFGTWKYNRGISKDKAKIANTVSEIGNISNQISELEKAKAEKQGELTRDVETLANNVNGQEAVKVETNKAIANFQAAINANSNVNATAAQIEEALGKLEDQ